MIIKTDGIGDYILFRNFLTELKTSEKYAGYELVLIGNIIWQELALELEKNVIYDFIPLDNTVSKINWYPILKKLSKYNYKAVLNFHYSRLLSTEIIALTANAIEKIAMVGDDFRINRFIKFFTNNIYSSLINIPESLQSEFDFIKCFTERIINKNININNPSIVLADEKSNKSLVNKSPFIVFAFGAGNKKRQIAVETAIKIVSMVLENYYAYFVGAESDKLMVSLIKERLPIKYVDKVIDLTGETSLANLPYIIKKSTCVICTESGAFHISVALNKPTLCIAGGGHFERFVQYANRMELRKVSICYQSMPCFNCNWNCKFKFAVDSPYPCIANIDIADIAKNFSLLERYF